jgi:hypothetical protein
MPGSPQRRRCIRIGRRVLRFAFDFLVDFGATMYALPDHSVFYQVQQMQGDRAEPLLSAAELRQWDGIVAELRRGPRGAARPVRPRPPR